MDYMQLKEQNKALNYRESLAGTRRIKSKPLFFWFDLYGPCNLECKHCAYREHGRTSEEDVSNALYEKVVQELMPTAYRCNLGGSNFGETTISSQFHRFLQDCKKHQVKVNLTTNGTRMTDEWFDDLLDVLEVVGFSMEGMNEQFEQMRGFKWRFFLKHVEKVCRGRDDRGKDFRVEFRFCAHADNIHQLPDIIRLAKSIGVNRVQVMSLVPYVKQQKYKMLHFHRSLANQYFAEARKISAETGVIVNVPNDFETGSFAEPQLLQLGMPNQKRQLIETLQMEMANCYFPWQACSINEIGNVTPCCVHWKSMGNLKTQSFDSVWNGRRYRRLRGGVNTSPDSICHACRRPQFDGEDTRAFSQLMPGIKDMIRNLFTFKRTSVTFKGTLGTDFIPGLKRPEAESAELMQHT